MAVAMGISGTIALVFVAISLLVTIEAAFNDIWGVERGRSWLARIEHYWAAITLGPFLLLATALIAGGQFQTFRAYVEWFPWVGHLILQLVPLAILCLAFMLFYQTMPNTKVRWQASLVGGVVGYITRGRRAATWLRARVAICRTAADVLPTAAAISSYGVSKTSRSTNTARSVGPSVSSTVSIAIDTLSASSTSSATSGAVSSGSGSHSPT